LDKEGNEQLSSENTEEFSTIFLNPTNSNDLYGAWDNEFITNASISDVQEAKVYAWIQDLPEILMFSILRAQKG